MTSLAVNHSAWEDKLDESFLKAITCVDKIEDVEDLQLCNLGITDDYLKAEVFNKLTSLVELNLAGNQLTCIPEGIALNNLQYLDMSQNCLNDVEWFARFPNLKDVDIADNVELTIHDRYKITFLLEKLQFLDGKHIDDRNRIGKNFTIDLLARMEILWNQQFKESLSNGDSEEKVQAVLTEFTEMAKEKIRIGPNSLKGYRQWRIESIAKDLVKFKISSPYADLLHMLYDDDEIKDVCGSPNMRAQKRKAKDDTSSKQAKPQEDSTSGKVFATYEPFVFLQCHGKEEGPSDFSTQVWCCQFEPDFNHSRKTTNIVATCGGNTVCVVDCETAKVKLRFEQINEEFYTVAWTTITLNNHPTSILVAAGALGFMHLIHASQAICYGRIKAHSHPIQTISFAPSSPTHLISADKEGNVFLIDIDIPTVPEYKFAWKKLIKFVGLDCTPLKLQVVGDFLLSATEYGLHCWKSDNGFKLNSHSKGKSVKEVPVCCEIAFPHTEDEPMVDALTMLTDDIVATKCAQQGVILMWRFSEFRDKISRMGKTKESKVRVNLLAELKWSSTMQCYIDIDTCREQLAVIAGDGEGNIWLYDASSLVKPKMKKSKSSITQTVIQPDSIIPFPHCVSSNGEGIAKLKNKTIYNDICCSSDLQHIVVTGDNNLVGIFRQKKLSRN